MPPGSALFGQPPNNQDDWFIIRGFARSLGIPDGVLNPSHGFPSPLQRPPNSPYVSRGPSMIASTAVAMALVILITAARLGLRYFRRDLKVGYDDFVIVPAALATVAYMAVAIGQVVYGGAGKHVYDMTYQELNWFYELGFIGIVVFWMAVGLIKVSIVFFNRRLTGLTSHRWMIAHYVFLALIVGFMITALFTELFQCTGPVDLKFSLIALGRHPTGNKCLNGNKLGYGLAIIHSTFDFALLTVPLIVLYQMRMSTGKKIRLGFLFSIGSLSCIGSVMRQVVQARTYTDFDFSWTFRQELAWIIVDIFFGIVAASLPVLNAILPKRWRSSSNHTPQLRHLSIFKSDPRDSIKLESKDALPRPDGTIVEGAGQIDKDSFHTKTEKRWDDAFVKVQRPEPVQDSGTRQGADLSDDTLV
ncbi:hypothetical protein HO133_006351 [Letharia lupina]|uniref:Rhodopsin domain-containing protein n=1 Tax=Letharia lupina TaxID=560253 RepID=A0A8H6F7X0_9LECA|nr:uncharacterized protein HO133_006351 [Letharia lupina]KAF6217939.1 hypothetical protein HO133_006351 [Letharia lupina]